MVSNTKSLPLVYACSGCSSAAQLANHVAVRLDRRGEAEMSCIAGVGGDVPALLRLAQSGRPMMAIDGCPLVCAKKTLERHGIEPDEHMQLADWGIKKRFHADFDPSDAERVLQRAVEIAQRLTHEEGRHGDEGRHEAESAASR